MRILDVQEIGDEDKEEPENGMISTRAVPVPARVRDQHERDPRRLVKRHLRRRNRHDADHNVEEGFERSGLDKGFLVAPQNLKHVGGMFHRRRDGPRHGDEKFH